MKCPGQDTRYWSGDASFEVPCPECGKKEEFFKDEASRRCRSCGHRILNPHMDFGCAAHCTYAKQCLGELPPELLARRKELLKDRVAVKMKTHFGTDFKRIGHAAKVARHAEEIARAEGAELATVLVAALLHDVGIKEAEQMAPEAPGTLHEQLGAAAAREILVAAGAEASLIEEVCDIVGHHHHPREQEAVTFKAVHDADLIVNLEDELHGSSKTREELDAIIERGFLTETGKAIARNIQAR